MKKIKKIKILSDLEIYKKIRKKWDRKPETQIITPKKGRGKKYTKRDRKKFKNWEREEGNE